jgi:aminopeptidase-like protein
MESKEIIENEKLANLMHHWCKKLYPITRSITGPGVRSTLDLLGEQLQGKLKVHEILSGTKAFDWTVPDEWTIRDAWVEDEQGHRIIDFKTHNLHVVGYSEPVDQWLDLDELEEHLYSLPEQPDAIPYITSYYQRRWGFCLTHNQRQQLKPGRYRAVVDADLKPGVLNYGELIIPGDSDREILLSTYVCHPSMANNELSGPVVTTAIAQWLQSLPRRRYTYRVVFIPETIGSLVYLSRHLEHLKRQVIAGFNVTCIGDERCFSYLPSRKGNMLSDRVAKHVLHHIDPEYKRYSWLDRGSDERQYCAPGIDLPIATIMRSKYGTYPEYHTSLDDLTLVTPKGLEGGFLALKTAVDVIESNCFPRVTVLGEPQLGKRGLYPNISIKGSANNIKVMMDLISYSDGSLSLLDIADLIDVPMIELTSLVSLLVEHNLLELSPLLDGV